jgi:hypothetical protein
MKATPLHYLTQEVESLSQEAQTTSSSNTSELKYHAEQMALLKGIMRGEKAVQNNHVFSNSESKLRLSKWM